MDQPDADRHQFRSFVYVSEQRLNEYLEQINDQARQGILARLQAAGVALHVGPAELSVNAQFTDSSVRQRAQAARIAVVEEGIREQHTVGDPTSGRHWIAGRVDMGWTPMEDSSVALFCGTSGPLLMVLGGSAANLRGRTSSGDRAGSHSYAIAEAIQHGGEPENLGRDLVDLAPQICVMPQPVQFLASVIARGSLPGEAEQDEYVIATPLYVEAIHADDAEVTRGQPLASADPDAIGRYRLLRRLGEGSMGTVYLALGEKANHVAVKVIRADLARNPEFLQRFRREAESARRISNPNVARVLDADTDADRPYIVTEFIDGLTLEERVKRDGSLPVSEAKSLCDGLAQALDAIHQARIVHRDLAPANVILSDAGPTVIDFGIARILDSKTRLTLTGMPIGTTAYMSPEQINEDPLTPASDIFSWAGVAVFASTGRQPFGNENAPWTAVWRDICEGSPHLADVPRFLRAPLTSALSKDPARRPTARHLHEWFSADPPRHWRPPGPSRPPRRALKMSAAAAAVVCAAAGAAIGLWAWLSPSGHSSACPAWLTGSPSPGLPQQGVAAWSGAPPSTLTSPDGNNVSDVAFSPSGHAIGAVTFGQDNDAPTRVYLWPTTHLDAPYSLSAKRGGNYPDSVAFSPTGNGLAVADANGVDLWNLDACATQTIADPDGNEPYSATYVPDSRTLVESNSLGHIFLLDTGNKRWFPVKFTDPVVYNHAENYLIAQIATVKQVFVEADSDYVNPNDNFNEEIYIRSLVGGNPINTWKVQAASQGTTYPGVNSVAFSPNGNYLAATSLGGTTLFNISNQNFSIRLTGSDTSPEAEAFSPNGTTLATGDRNGKIYLWNVATRQSTVISSNISKWGGLTFSPDGRTLAAFSFNSSKISLYQITYKTR